VVGGGGGGLLGGKRRFDQGVRRCDGPIVDGVRLAVTGGAGLGGGEGSLRDPEKHGVS